MHKCRNPECDKQIPDFLDYCGKECTTQDKERRTSHANQIAELNKDIQTPPTIPEAKTIEEIALIDPNEGTKSKTVLKNKALRLIATYPDNLTLRQYASLLCWDISVSFRTALEGYIEPMVEKGILLHVRENLYKVNLAFRRSQ